MGVKLSAVRSKVGLAVVGGALLLAGAGVGTAAASGAFEAETVSHSEPVTTPAQATPEPSRPQVEATPAEQPAASLPAATVDDVSTPEATQQAAPAPVEQDSSGVGTTGADGNYTAAPQVQRPGEPPVAPPPPLPVPEQPQDPEYDHQQG